VRCEESNYMHPIDVDRCTFYPTEIVSRIFSYNDGYFGEFVDVYNKILMSDEFVYMVNDSQGMHINISFPNFLNATSVHKVIQWWAYFDPAVRTFVAPARKDTHWAQDISTKIGPTGQSVADDWAGFYAQKTDETKYTSINVKNDGRLVEIRIVEGSMMLDFIEDWTTFCCRFVAAALLSDTAPTPMTYGTFDELYEFAGSMRLVRRWIAQAEGREEIEEAIFLLDRDQQEFRGVIKEIQKGPPAKDMSDEEIISSIEMFDKIESDDQTLRAREEDIQHVMKTYAKNNPLTNEEREKYRAYAAGISDRQCSRITDIDNTERRGEKIYDEEDSRGLRRHNTDFTHVLRR
jgi:hypothetical protein